MKIGHICLAPPDNEAGERFAALVEALARHGVGQHVLLADVALGRRLAPLAGVSVGPIVKTPVMAYCLMPNVDIVHIHEGRSGQAGLLLTLTRSIPFVINTDKSMPGDSNALTRSVLHRAARTMPEYEIPGLDDHDEIALHKHLNAYEDVLTGWRRTA